MNDEVVVLFLAGEDRRHREVSAALADRVLREHVAWLAGVDLDHVRRWQGRSAGEAYYRHKDAKEDARRLGFRAHGCIDGKPAGPEAQWIREILAVAGASSPDAAVIARDLDGRPERRASFDTVMRCFPPSFPVVYASPKQEIEAWILAGYEPADDDERRRLDEITAAIGFSPTTEPERLTSTARDSPKDAHAVCDRLVGKSEVREAACLGDLDLLRARGGGCGLCAYLEGVEEKLVPVVRAPLRRGRGAGPATEP